MNVNPQGEQTIEPLWAVKAQLHLGTGPVLLPIFHIRCAQLAGAADRIHDRMQRIRDFLPGLSMTLLSIERGPLTEPLGPANQRIAADALMNDMMNWLNDA